MTRDINWVCCIPIIVCDHSKPRVLSPNISSLDFSCYNDCNHCHCCWFFFFSFSVITYYICNYILNVTDVCILILLTTTSSYFIWRGFCCFFCFFPIQLSQMQVINSSIQSRYGEETEETEVYIVLPKERG